MQHELINELQCIVDLKMPFCLYAWRWPVAVLHCACSVWSVACYIRLSCATTLCAGRLVFGWRVGSLVFWVFHGLVGCVVLALVVTCWCGPGLIWLTSGVCSCVLVWEGRCWSGP